MAGSMNVIEAEKAFHRNRRMWAVVNGDLHIAPIGTELGHAGWFIQQKFGRPPDVFGTSTRGFADHRGLFAYRGPHFTPHGIGDEFYSNLDLLAANLKLPDTMTVWFGCRPGRVGELWSGIRNVGTIGSVIRQHQRIAA